jgi:hypothetical protein
MTPTPVDSLRWKKSRRSNQSGSCVELALLRDGLAVRDSKNPDGPTLAFPGGIGAGFVEAVKAGRYDR